MTHRAGEKGGKAHGTARAGQPPASCGAKQARGGRPARERRPWSRVQHLCLSGSAMAATHRSHTTNTPLSQAGLTSQVCTEAQELARCAGAQARGGKAADSAACVHGASRAGSPSLMMHTPAPAASSIRAAMQRCALGPADPCLHLSSRHSPCQLCSSTVHAGGGRQGAEAGGSAAPRRDETSRRHGTSGRVGRRAVRCLPALNIARWHLVGRRASCRDHPQSRATP